MAVLKFSKIFDHPLQDLPETSRKKSELSVGKPTETSLFSFPHCRPQCSSIFSIKIPYPLLASCTSTWVTAPIR